MAGKFDARAACGEASPWTSLRGLRRAGAEEGNTTTTHPFKRRGRGFHVIQVIRGVGVVSVARSYATYEQQNSAANGDSSMYMILPLPIGMGVFDLTTVKDSPHLALHSGYSTGGSSKGVGDEEEGVPFPFFPSDSLEDCQRRKADRASNLGGR